MGVKFEIDGIEPVGHAFGSILFRFGDETGGSAVDEFGLPSGKKAFTIMREK